MVGVTPGACQSSGAGDTACSYPWAHDPRADAKADLFEFVASTPEGANLPYIVRTVFGRDVDLAGADARLARRFFDNHPELFEIDRRDDFVWVFPRPAAFHLTAGKRSAKNEDGGGAKANAPGIGGEYAKDRARSFLSKWSTVGSDSTRADLLRELATERESVADTWQVFERIRGNGPEYLCLPYRNRFNSTDRAGDLLASWRRAWRRARGRYDDAVLVTLTTDPGMHDSIADATEALIENKNRLSSWLEYDPKSGPSRPGFRPTNLSVLEFTDSGLPHLHVVYFGIRWVTTQGELADYWEGRGQGRVVDVRQLSKRGGEFVMRTDDLPDDNTAGKRTARAYLGKSIRTLLTIADMTPADVFDAATSRRAGDDRDDTPDDLWKLALYWALEKRFFSGSPELTTDGTDSDDDADSVPHVPRYRFVGVAQYNDLPGYVRSRARFVTPGHVDRGQPPPTEIG